MTGAHQDTQRAFGSTSRRLVASLLKRTPYTIAVATLGISAFAALGCVSQSSRSTHQTHEVKDTADAPRFTYGSGKKIDGSTSVKFDQIVTEDVCAVTRWSVPSPETPGEIPSEYLCVGFNTGRDNAGEVRFYQHQEDGYRLCYVFSSEWRFAEFAPFPEGSLLLCFCSVSTASYFVALGDVNHEIRPIWESVNGDYPEIVDLDNDGRFEVVTAGKDVVLWNADTNLPSHFPSERWVYKRLGTDYQLVKKLRWSKGVAKMPLPDKALLGESGN